MVINMKIQKTQILMPKTKNVTQSLKCVKNGKNCTQTSTTQVGNNEVRMLSTSCGKSDVLLSKAQLVTNSQQPILWSEDGILRQALMNTDKNIKCEKNSDENVQTVDVTEVPSVSAPLVTLSYSSQPTLLTTVVSPQVIMMSSELGSSPIILSSEPIQIPTVSWQNTDKKDGEPSSVSGCNVPIIASQNLEQQTTELLVENEGASYSSLSPIIFNQNVIPTVLTKDRKNPLKGNLLLNAGYNITLSETNKKSNTRNVGKCNKNRRKIITDKQLLLKPTNSLLSTIALDFSLDESKGQVLNVETPNNNVLANTEMIEVSHFTNDSSPARVIVSDVSLSSTNQLTVTSNSSNSYNSSLNGVNSENVSLSNLSIDKGHFSQCLNNDQHINAERNHILYHSSDGHLLHHSNSQPNNILTTPTSIQNHISILNLNPGMIHHTNALINGNNYSRESTPVILSSDMDHDSVQSGQNDPGYHEGLLSQFSNELPNISSSQVSSVLLSLASEHKSPHLKKLDNIQQNKAQESSVKYKLGSTDYKKNNEIVKEEKWTLIRQKDNVVYRCILCLFISLDKENVNKHYDCEHDNETLEIVRNQIKDKEIACIGCDNIFFSQGSLQFHLLLDHKVFETELEKFKKIIFEKSNTEPRKINRIGNITPKIVTSLGVNKAIQSSQTNILPTLSSTNMLSLQSDPVLTSASLQTLTTTTAMPQPSTRTVPLLLESTTCTEIKDTAQPSLQTAQITPIPTFSLFSNVDQLTEKNGNHENTDKLQEDSSQKKSRPKGSQILKFIPKKVKLTGIKIEQKDTTESRCSINGCIVRLSTQSDMEYHRQCHEEGGSFKCPICSHLTSQWNSMSIHLWKDHRINMDLFSCEQCTYKTNSFSKLNQHCKIHGEERPYLCDTCGKGFKTTKQLRNHKVIHRSRVRVTEEGVEVNGPLRRHFVCKICNRTFAEKRVVRQHIETVHNKVKSFLCSCCGHTASSRSALRMHIRQHTGEKPFSCEHCPYNTADHNSLRRHIMRHTGKYPYRCPHCSYACIQSTTYKTHLKNKHPGMNEGIMFDCPDCSFRTVKKDNLLSHIAEHALGADPRTRRKNYSQQNAMKIGENIPDDPVAINEDSSPELIVADSNPT